MSIEICLPSDADSLEEPMFRQADCDSIVWTDGIGAGWATAVEEGLGAAGGRQSLRGFGGGGFDWDRGGAGASEVGEVSWAPSGGLMVRFAKARGSGIDKSPCCSKEA